MREMQKTRCTPVSAGALLLFLCSGIWHFSVVLLCPFPLQVRKKKIVNGPS